MLFPIATLKKAMYKLITCIAAENKIPDTVQGLFRDFGLRAGVYNFARGFGRSSSEATRGLGQQTEKGVLSVVVQANQVDEIFAYIFDKADVNRPHCGIVYVTAIQQHAGSPAINLAPPELDNE